MRSFPHLPHVSIVKVKSEANSREQAGDGRFAQQRRVAQEAPLLKGARFEALCSVSGQSIQSTKFHTET